MARFSSVVNADAIPSGPLSISCSIRSVMILSFLSCMSVLLAKEKTEMGLRVGQGHGPDRRD